MSDSPFGPVIDSYTRAEAIADGVLIDVSQQAKEAGFSIPVAMTDSLFNGYIVPDDRAKCQDLSGRLWDVFSVLKYHIRRNPTASEIRFEVVLTMKEKQRRVIRLKSVVHGGDDLEPVMTISLPEED